MFSDDESSGGGGGGVQLVRLRQDGAFEKQKKKRSYIGVEQVHAVQALAAVNAALDAPQGRFALAHGQ